MSKKMKEKILEIVDIVKECPENLQEKCFELLLSHHLNDGFVKPEKMKEPGIEDHNTEDDSISKVDIKSQEDMSDRDLHVKVKKFLKDNGLSVDNLNQLFYKEGTDFKALYDDLKTTVASESQIRIALLHALLEAMKSGKFSFDGENVRAEALERKCYDAGNFTAYFKNNKNLFDGFSKYNKSKPTINLSTRGKNKLAEIIKELQ